MPIISAFGSSSSLEQLGFDQFHRRDSFLFPEQIHPQGQIPDLGFSAEKIEYVHVESILAGTITSQAITLAVLAGDGDVKIQAGKTDFNSTATGFILGLDDSDNDEVKLNIGDATSYLDWNVTTADTLTIAGSVTATSGAIGGWNITATTLYALASGTPSASPTDGIVLTSGATSNIIVYEDAAERVRIGNLSAGVFGILGYATDGATKLFELSDTQNFIAGWTISSSTLANGTNIILNATSAAISLNSATFGTDGIQLEYNAGNPRGYIGNGSTQFFQFDGTTISWGAVNSTLSAAGLLTTTSALIGGWNVVDGYIYNLQSGTPTAVPNDGVVLASGNEALLVYEDTALRTELGYLSAVIYGLKIYATNGSTVIFEASDTQQMMAGWAFTDAQLSSGSVIINSANQQMLFGSATAPLTGTGIFEGLSGGAYQARFGDPT